MDGTCEIYNSPLRIGEKSNAVEPQLLWDVRDRVGGCGDNPVIGVELGSSHTVT